ncbi:hypothetical protein NK553_23965 [Pseudomonas sp. ZM23]|uniref:Lipoprotein n=1 Tax=Pseudomonas triclosanedens TaxID=2961893 RepID=A0ABY6ZSB1_9PSED|nr:hypothetical protein [Pseudomonas triclosanedens]MCP8467017.1 hypothetical protein [Pseudomonas triclosanedens]MCP8472835.1 hypothetical protein [Pseudomonas triclosanedens]MCP8478266.1 hypothetical protein [Pseudomonas triclosanedens]WAI47671.1 hypothetical protein OU419_18035 [Pseudomonas triclosanedens]
MSHLMKLSRRPRSLALAITLLTACGAALAEPAAQPPRGFQPLVMLAHQQLLEGDLASAQALLREAGAQGQGGTRALAEQAFIEDAGGRHVRARQFYDALKGSDQAAVIALPSAVNLAALGRFDQAGKAFAELQKTSPNPRLQAYAGFWNMWLTARQASDAGLKPATAKARVEKLARGIKPATEQQRAMLALYQGKSDISTVFAEIDALQAPDAVKRDLRTEAGLFAGAYLDYVRQDHQGALRAYERALQQSRPSAMERPQLIQSSRALQLSSR